MAGMFKYTPSHEVDARHRAAQAKVSPRETRLGEQKNIETVLSIGSSRYFQYRGYLMRVPPVPYKAGQQILALYVKSLATAKEVTKTGSEKEVANYYVLLSMLVDLLWKHVEPAGKIRRALKRMHLLRNVFKVASEKEVTEITSFFLQCRMMSSVQVTEASPIGASTQTSSMNSKSS
jgi:hypothetical protein